MSWPVATGEIATRIGAFDWSQTPLGAIENWPESLRTAVGLMLASGHAMQLAWGPAQTILYNDLYAPMLADRHPDALGLPFQKAWPDIWDEIKPLVGRVFDGETVRFESMPLTMIRYGRAEETWWDFSYSPVRDEAGAVAGLLNVTVDATPRKRAERAEAALHDSEARYQALFAASPVPFMVLEPNRPDFTILAANEAYFAATLTTPETLIGRRLFDIFTDDPSRPGQLGSQALDVSLERVLRTRKADAMERVRYDIVTPDGGFEEHWWLAINAPLLDAAGEVASIIHQVDRQTEQRFAEEAEREHRQRETFLSKFSDALRPLGDADVVKATAARLLGQHLGANRAFYGEVEGDDWIILGDYEQGIVPLTPGRYAASTYGDWMMQTCRRGEVMDFSDAHADPRFSQSEREALAGFQITAALGIGLVKDGTLCAILSVHSATPRSWTPGEAALLREVAERTWMAVERARAEAALRESDEQQRMTLELVPALLWWADPAGDQITGMHQWQNYTGQNEEDVQAYGWLNAIHPDDKETTQAAFENAFATGEPLKRQQRIRRNGDGYRWHLVRHVPVRDADGTVVRWFGAAVDIDDLRRLQEEQTVMVAELQHRTRNLIGVVGMIMRQILASSSSLADFRVRFSERLEALSRVQGLFARKDDEAIGIGDIVRLELEALGADLSSDRVRIDGEAVILRKSSVQTLALAIHELATNARKYGALHAEAGELVVRWTEYATEAGKRRLRLEWTETGIDPQVEETEGPMHRGGYRRKLIEEALPYTLKAKTTYTLGSGRLDCTVDMPLDR